MRASALLESALLVVSIACRSQPASEQAPLPEPGTRPAGPMLCQGDTCRQEHPRLPDTGEWRCAELGKVVWCAGGEPAAGVTPGAPDSKFRCGARWGERATHGERVCVDAQPDYPSEARDEYECKYEQERGVTRVCRKQKRDARPLATAGALPACYLDVDCPSGGCDRGACRCVTDAHCVRGSCVNGVCAGAAH